MNLFDQFNQYLFSIGDNDILLKHILGSILSGVLLFAFYFGIKRTLWPWYVRKHELDKTETGKLNRAFVLFLFILWLTATFLSLDLDFSIHEFAYFDFQFSHVLKSLLAVQFASLMIRLATELIQYSYYRGLPEETRKSQEIIAKIQHAVKSTTRYAKWLIYILTGLFLLDLFELDRVLFSFKNSDIKISGVLLAIGMLVGARIVSWFLTKIALTGYYSRSTRAMDEGTQYAINQLVNYFLYTFAFIFALSAMGINVTLLWGGAAALLVGVGLGLQQTFNDVFSGILLLFERSVEVGDWVEMEGLVGKVVRIGLRTSVVKSRDNIAVVVPNSKLTTEKVINWSHVDAKTRFKLSVGVAYDSDIDLVQKILLDIANSHPDTYKNPAPTVQLVNFGDSSLDFVLLFWANNFLALEVIMSEMRMDIVKRFRENDITIPFPQRDIWTRE